MSNLLLSAVIAATYGAPVAIVSVTGNGVTPIQLTTGSPHGLSTGDWIQVSGVQGNTAANVSDQATAIDALNFTVPGTGNGAYTSGGTVAPFYGMANGLARVSHAPLIDNAIPVGPEFNNENSDTPRVVVVPEGSSPMGPQAFNSALTVAGGILSTPSVLPAIGGWKINATAIVWGVDFDDTEDLIDQFVRSFLYATSTGNGQVGAHKYVRKTNLAQRGRKTMLPISWYRPITRVAIGDPIHTGGAGTHGTAALYIDKSGNATGQNPVTVND